MESLKKFLQKKNFKNQKPSKDEIIVVKSVRSFYPEIGIFQTFENGIEQVYIPASDDVEDIPNIEWWCEVPE